MLICSLRPLWWIWRLICAHGCLIILNCSKPNIKVVRFQRFHVGGNNFGEFRRFSRSDFSVGNGGSNFGQCFAGVGWLS